MAPDYIQPKGKFAQPRCRRNGGSPSCFTICFWPARRSSLPWWLLQMRLPKYRAGLMERLGQVPERLQGDQCGSIWVHAVSVGEVLAVSQLITELQKKYPDRKIFISTTTATGQSLARQRFGEDHVFFMPLDFGSLCGPISML